MHNQKNNCHLKNFLKRKEKNGTNLNIKKLEEKTYKKSLI
jgi:hypothetical protein